MPQPAPKLSHLLHLLPEERIGAVERVEPIAMGLSGAGVYAVTAARGAFVLRVRAQDAGQGTFAQQLLVLRRAADAGVAPAVVHVDESARAVVSARVPGVPMAAALANPAQRGALFASIVEQLRVLHALDTSGIAEADPIAYTRQAWEAGRQRPGFPPWAASLAPQIDAFAAALANDRRRVLSHNDLNPVNVMWDGTRAWLVDWDVAGLNHPYYDLATMALFLRLGDDVAFELLAGQEGAPPDEPSRATFHALRQLVGMLCGLTFLGLVDDLAVRPAPTLADAPSLGDCYAAMRAGQLDVQKPLGRASMGLALLALGVGRKEG